MKDQKRKLSDPQSLGAFPHNLDHFTPHLELQKAQLAQELGVSPQRHAPLYLGHTQLATSRVGVGTWAIGGGWGPQPEAQSLQALHEALEQGCLLIDTAALYGNGRAEKIIAQAFRESQKRVTTLTKIYPLHYHWSPSAGTPMRDIYPPEHIIAQAEASLRRLETDCLDCLLF